MAYTHSKYEVEMQPYTPSTAPAAGQYGVDIGTTGLKAKWAPGFVPHLIRGASITSLVTAAPASAASYGFEADITTPGTATRLFTILQPTTVGAHQVMYHLATREIQINPGQVVDFTVTALHTAAATAKVVLYVEPKWETPSNVTSMVATT